MLGDAPRPRVGMIGGGFMATIHSRAATAAGAELTVLASSTAAAAKRAAGQLGFARSADSVEELIETPDVDVIHVCTPNASHADIARAALGAGKHVICEKPLATDAPSAVQLDNYARSTGLVATVPFVYRFHPMAREARHLIAAGSLGPVTSLQGSYLQDWLLEKEDDNWRVDSAAGGSSRAFADIGSHLVDMVEFVTGLRIESLCALTRTVHPTRAGRQVLTEDIAAVMVRLANGAVGTLLVSQVAAGHANDLRFEIFGTDGSVAFAQETPDTLTVGHRGRVETRVRDTAALSTDAARLSIVPPGHPMGYQDAFNAFIRDTYSAFGGAAPKGLPTFADGARASRITDAVLASAARGGWVDLEASAIRPAA